MFLLEGNVFNKLAQSLEKRTGRRMRRGRETFLPQIGTMINGMECGGGGGDEGHLASGRKQENIDTYNNTYRFQIGE
jgi:hypothetical protein